MKKPSLKKRAYHLFADIRLIEAEGRGWNDRAPTLAEKQTRVLARIEKALLEERI